MSAEDHILSMRAALAESATTVTTETADATLDADPNAIAKFSELFDAKFGGTDGDMNGAGALVPGAVNNVLSDDAYLDALIESLKLSES